MRWILSKRASADIDSIIRYTNAHFGAAQTEELLAAFIRASTRMGRVWSGERRCYIYRQHYVFYRTRQNDLFVTHIRNTRQRLPESWRKD